MDKSFPLIGWGSLAVHGGHKQDPNYAHLVPIYASSTYVFDDAEQGMRRFSGKEEGYIYSRWGNPTMTERIIVPSENFNGTMVELANNLSQQSKQWKDWVDSTPESSLDHVFQYYNKKKEHFKLPIYQMLHHVFNHGTYHRGQLINILRQLGVEKVPQTDFSFWIQSKK